MEIHGFALPQLLSTSLYPRLDALGLFRIKQSYEDYNFHLRIKQKNIFKILKNPDSTPSPDFEHPSIFVKAEENDLKVKVEAEESQEKPAPLPISNMSKKILKKPIFKCIRMPKVQNTPKVAATLKKRATWHASEDELLLELMKEHGTRWAQVAVHMEGRNGKQVRDRYLNVLKPGRKKARWSKKEDRLLLKMYNKWGHKWCQIAKTLPGRTEIQVKNRYYTCLKKRVNEGEMEMEQENQIIETKIEIKMEAGLETTEPNNESNIQPKIESCINVKLEGIAMVKQEIADYPNKFQIKEEVCFHESLKSEETTD